MTILKTIAIFLPLLVMTMYIIIRSIMDRKDEMTEQSFREFFISLAERMLEKENRHIDPEDCEISFSHLDISDENDPSASFVIETDDGKIPFDIKDGKIIRHRITR